MIVTPHSLHHLATSIIDRRGLRRQHLPLSVGEDGRFVVVWTRSGNNLVRAEYRTVIPLHEAEEWILSRIDRPWGLLPVTCMQSTEQRWDAAMGEYDPNKMRQYTTGPVD